MQSMVSRSATRRAFLAASGISVIGVAGCASASTMPAAPAIQIEPTVASTVAPTSNQTLQKLLAGNLRFQRGQAQWPNQTVARRQAIAPKQTPLAMVLGCVDSRVPPELVFDQGLGDIFNIRTAGHVVDSMVMGSIEVGIAEYGIPLLVVLGHQRCGAVSVAMRAVEHQEEEQGHIQALVEYIRPSVVSAQGNGDERLANAVHNNIIYTVSRLSESKIISAAVKTGKLTIVAGHYSLDTGAVSIITN